MAVAVVAAATQAAFAATEIVVVVADGRGACGNARNATY